MNINPRHVKRRNAAAAVECAIILSVLVPLLVGVWEIGRLVNVHQKVSNAAREAGRRAATGEHTKAEIEQIVLTYFKNAGLDTIQAVAANESELSSGGKVLVELKLYDTKGNLISNGDPKNDAQQMYKLELTVTLLFNDVEYSPTDMFLAPDFLVSSVAVWHSMKDVPVIVNDSIPLS